MCSNTFLFVSLPVRITPGWFLQSLTSLIWTTSSMLEPQLIWKEVWDHAGDQWKMRVSAHQLEKHWAQFRHIFHFRVQLDSQLAFKRTLWLLYNSQAQRIKWTPDLFSVTASKLGVVLHSKVWLSSLRISVDTYRNNPTAVFQNCKEKYSMTCGTTIHCTVTTERRKTQTLICKTVKLEI